MAELPISNEGAGVEIKELILKTGIDSLTGKAIREHLETKFNCSLSGFKKEIDEITLKKIQEYNAEKSNGNADGVDKESSESESSSCDESVDDMEVRKKASKKRRAVEALSDDNDEDIASKVKRSRRSTAAPPKKKSTTKKRRKGTSCYSRFCVLSDELTEILGKKYMRRHEVVKQMWAYFKSNNLLDPNDKRKVVPDEKLKKVFGAKKFLAFGMMSTLKGHITDTHSFDEETRNRMTEEIKLEYGSDYDKIVSDGEEDDEEDNKSNKKAKKRKDAAENGVTVKRNRGGFVAICELSDDLSALTGIRYLRRCDVMKFMWAYFRLHNLFDPKDRRLVVLNEPLKKVFGNSPKKIRAFGIMSTLSKHITPIKFSDDETRERIAKEVETFVEQIPDTKTGKSSSNGVKSEKAADGVKEEVVDSGVEPGNSFSNGTDTSKSVTSDAVKEKETDEDEMSNGSGNNGEASASGAVAIKENDESEEEDDDSSESSSDSNDSSSEND